MSEIKGCPFCGRDDSEDNAVQSAAIICCRFKAATGVMVEQVQCVCGAKGAMCATAKEAIAAWNRRQPISEDDIARVIALMKCHPTQLTSKMIESARPTAKAIIAHMTGKAGT